ncbi:MAG: hypothetical protein HZB22_05315 [Deltaproteobacteria bacterium]|nr:hypothetical protein [Deltaproteobacteria bacterium]
MEQKGNIYSTPHGFIGIKSFCSQAAGAPPAMLIDGGLRRTEVGGRGKDLEIKKARLLKAWLLDHKAPRLKLKLPAAFPRGIFDI